MKELQQIIRAYTQSKSESQKVALATVVQVDGSAYRRPGARMLVTEEGNLTGAISGGCLEGDALRKAQAVIFQQKSMLVTYDTTDEDDQKFGVGLGCNGIIHVLIEPINYEDAQNPIELIKSAVSDRQVGLLLTLFSIKRSKSEQIGTVLLDKGGVRSGNWVARITSPSLRRLLEEEIDSFNFGSQIKRYRDHDDISVFFEVLKPSPRILLFGAGNDTQPLAKMAEIMGFELVLIDGRKSLASQVRFPSAKQIIHGTAEEVSPKLETDQHTVALLMTHNFEYEATVLEKLTSCPIPYIGILGPKRKTEKLIQRLENKGIPVHTGNIYAPMGLDIGAEGSEEIALSILAEVKAVLAKKPATFLRDKNGPIHEQNQ
jgi:xanthine dehydrogenase accessory factor